MNVELYNHSHVCVIHFVIHFSTLYSSFYFCFLSPPYTHNIIVNNIESIKLKVTFLATNCTKNIDQYLVH